MGIHAACCDDLVKALTPSLLQKNIQKLYVDPVMLQYKNLNSGLEQGSLKIYIHTHVTCHFVLFIRFRFHNFPPLFFLSFSESNAVPITTNSATTQNFVHKDTFYFVPCITKLAAFLYLSNAHWKLFS